MVEINDNPANHQDIGPLPPNPLPSPRVPHTHINPDVIQLLKELPLYDKLEKNKQHEADNIAQKMRKVNHKMNLEAHPVDALDFVSLVTIDEADMNQLLDDELRAQYRLVMSIASTKWVAETNTFHSPTHSGRNPVEWAGIHSIPAGMDRNPQESGRNGPESTGIRQEWTRFCRIPAGMDQE
jgi:hypothetical protein